VTWRPLKPGVGTPPLSVITPVVLEKYGSSTHNEKIEPDLLIERMSNMSVGNAMVASALFTATPSEFNTMFSVIDSPAETLDASAFNLRVAA
jgi:hypothetical protein